jgi:hypothetical protein
MREMAANILRHRRNLLRGQCPFERRHHAPCLARRRADAMQNDKASSAPRWISAALNDDTAGCATGAIAGRCAQSMKPLSPARMAKRMKPAILKEDRIFG